MTSLLSGTHRLNVERFHRDVAVVQHLDAHVFDGEALDALDNDALRSRLADAVASMCTLEHPRALEELFAIGALHADPEVRKTVLRFAATLVHREPAARKLILWLLSDDEDHVIFEAVRIAGRERIGEALDELFAISGRGSGKLETSEKPVGVGASVVLRAQLAIFGTRDPKRLFELEEAYVERGELPEGTSFDEHVLYCAHDLATPAGMIRIPAGPFICGVDVTDVRRPLFDSREVMPRTVEELPEFFIDEYPVINADYDAWTALPEARAHLLCHPDEAPDKDHRRGTRRDERLSPADPATGVDWYDAYAYLAHLGKELPSEFEWEKAARGEDGRLFPWGDEFDPRATRWAGETFGVRPGSIPEWRELLQEHTETFPATLTVPVDAHDEHGASPYGVKDLIGNSWEWTRTNHYTRRDMQPAVAGRPRPEWAYSPESYAVIKGGAWSSIPEEASAFFRGKDLFTDRHNEIGFRGVIR